MEGYEVKRATCERHFTARPKRTWRFFITRPSSCARARHGGRASHKAGFTTSLPSTRDVGGGGVW